MALIAHNATRERDLMTQGLTADRPWSRVRGLIGCAPLKEGQGLWITPCNGIHMLFMSFAIDAVYLDRERRIVALDADMAPWQLGRFIRGAHSVLELPAGTIAATGTEVGDQLILTRVSEGAERAPMSRTAGR